MGRRRRVFLVLKHALNKMMTPRAPERSEGGEARSAGGRAPAHCKEVDTRAWRRSCAIANKDDFTAARRDGRDRRRTAASVLRPRSVASAWRARGAGNGASRIVPTARLTAPKAGAASVPQSTQTHYRLAPSRSSRGRGRNVAHDSKGDAARFAASKERCHREPPSVARAAKRRSAGGGAPAHCKENGL